MANTAQRVVAKFGSQTRLAEAIGAGQSTVANWVKIGAVPRKWHDKILQAAAQRGLALASDELTPALVEVLVPSVLPHAVSLGVLTVGDEDGAPSIACYVLSDGRRVISRTSALNAIAGGEDHSLGGDLRSYVKHVSSFLHVDLDDELIEFKLYNVTHKRVFGITRTAFPKSVARTGELVMEMLSTERQHEIPKKASAFLAACANVGLIALIDEATGYQYQRAEDALRVKLRAYLAEEMRSWEKTFPDELWIEFGRLTGWKGSVQHRPKYWGKLVNELVYGYLDPDVFDWLKNNAPPPRHGQNYHQWLSATSA